MKKLFLPCLFALLPLFLFSQAAVGINEDGSSPNLKSILDVKSTTKGFLAPRMNSADRILIAPGINEKGLVVYDTDMNKYMVYNGSQWETIGDGLWLPHANGAYRLNRIGINNTPLTNTSVYVFGNGPVGPDTSLMYVYRNGSGVTTEGGIDFSLTGIDAGIKSYAFWGNKFSAAIAAYSFLDYNQSCALAAGRQDGTTLALLGYKDNGGLFWAGHFTGDVRVTDQLGVGTNPSSAVCLDAASSVYDRTGYFENTKNSASTTFGLYANASGAGSGAKRAGSFDAMGGTGINIGVRAFASGGSIAWAGYFAAGDVYMAGDLAIGSETTATGYKVSVNGKIISTELRIQDMADWPDYVFEEDYHLMSLYELEASIQKEKHLPEMPSAKEVENEGIMVGEIQSLMLKKIEELTLYTIAQQKQIDEQRNQIEALQQIILSKMK